MPASKRPSTRRQPPQPPKLTPQVIFSSQRSPLLEPGKVDLQLFLAKCFSAERWDEYTQEERNLIMDSLPRSIAQRTSSGATLQGSGDDKAELLHGRNEATLTPQNCPVSPDELLNNSYVKQATTRFVRDVGDGYYEKAWQNKAEHAQKARSDGKFDEYIRERNENLFRDDQDVTEEAGLDSEDDEEEVSYIEDTRARKR